MPPSLRIKAACTRDTILWNNRAMSCYAGGDTRGADSRCDDASGKDDHQTSASAVGRSHAPDESERSDDEQQVREHVG